MLEAGSRVPGLEPIAESRVLGAGFACRSLGARYRISGADRRELDLGCWVLVLRVGHLVPGVGCRGPELGAGLRVRRSSCCGVVRMRIACLAVVVFVGACGCGPRVWRSLDYAVGVCAVVWVEQDTRTRCLGDCPVGTVAGMTPAPSVPSVPSVPSAPSRPVPSCPVPSCPVLSCPLLPPLALPGMTHPDANILSRIGREGDFRRLCGCTVACGTRFCTVPSCRLSGLFHPDASIPPRFGGEGCFFGRWGVESQDCGAQTCHCPVVCLFGYPVAPTIPMAPAECLAAGVCYGVLRCAAVFVRR